MFNVCLKRPVLNLSRNNGTLLGSSPGCKLCLKARSVSSKRQHTYSHGCKLSDIHVFMRTVCPGPSVLTVRTTSPRRNASHRSKETGMHIPPMLLSWSHCKEQTQVWCPPPKQPLENSFNGSVASTSSSLLNKEQWQKKKWVCKVNVSSIPLMPWDIFLHLSPLSARCEAVE